MKYTAVSVRQLERKGKPWQARAKYKDVYGLIRSSPAEQWQAKADRYHSAAEEPGIHTAPKQQSQAKAEQATPL